jgi:hypothetical protein
MQTSAQRLIVVLGAGLLVAAGPPAEQGPSLGDAALPAPRALHAGPPRQEPAPAPREEPVPAPREQLVPPFVVMPSGPAHEEPAPMPHEQTPAPPRLAIPSTLRSAPSADIQALHREIEGLRMEREALLSEQTDLLSSKPLRAAHSDDTARLRRRIAQVLMRAAQMSRAAPAPSSDAKLEPAASPPRSGTGSPPQPTEELHVPRPADTRHVPPADGSHPTSSVKSSPHTDNSGKTGTNTPVDSRTLAETLFLAGDHASALKIYRQLEQEEQRGDERTVLQYMIACCLRKLGKFDEASLLYREVANSGGDEVLMENAQWYLREMKERRELEGQLDEFRQRRKALNPRKP